MLHAIPARVRPLFDRLEDGRLRHGCGALVAVSTAALGLLTTIAGPPELQRWALVLPLVPFLALDLVAGDRGRALTHLLAWAAGVTALGFVLGLCGVTPALLGTDAGWLVDDTLRFAHRGDGVPVRAADFATDHLLDYVYVCAGSALGGGLAPVLMGAKHILWISWQWGALVDITGGSPRAWLAGLPPWSGVGALGYAMVVVGWAEVTGAVLGRRAVAWGTLARWTALGTATLAAHLLLRIALVDPWGAVLAAAF